MLLRRVGAPATHRAAHATAIKRIARAPLNVRAMSFLGEALKGAKVSSARGCDQLESARRAGRAV